MKPYNKELLLFLESNWHRFGIAYKLKAIAGEL